MRCKPRQGWFLMVVIVICLTLTLAVDRARGAASYDWPEFAEGDWSGIHSGSNIQEQAISPATVSSLSRQFQVMLPSPEDGVPVYLSGITVGSNIKDLLFLTTGDGHTMALDAHTGATVWSDQYGSNGCVSTQGTSCYTTSSPVIDPNRQYVYVYGLDGYVHKLQVGTGTEVTRNGWPELATLKPSQEKSSPALSVASTASGTYLYVTNGGYPGDAGDYQGHITAINLATGTQRVFNALCSNQAVHFSNGGSPDCAQAQAAVWARPGVVYDSDTKEIYFSTGNGSYAPTSYDWGDSVLALYPDGSGSSTIAGYPVDSYTPTNYASLQANDADLGSTAPAILPSSAVPSNSLYRHLAVQSGKDGYVRLLNLDNLSGQGGPGHTGGELAVEALPSGIFGEVLSQPAVWVNPADSRTWVFVTNNSGIAALSLTVDTSGKPGLQVQWSASATVRDSLGSSPLVANGVLFDARPNLIEARSPTTGQQLWKDTTIGDIHWQHPMVANGTLYISDGSRHLTAFGLAATVTPTSSPTVTPTPIPLTNTPVLPTPTNTPTTTLTPITTPMPTVTPSPTVSMIGVTAAPAVVLPGWAESLGATVRVTGSLTKPLIIFLVYNGSGKIVYQNYVQTSTITNTTRTVMATQYLSASTPAGIYYPLVAVTDSTGAHLYTWRLGNTYLVL